VWPFQFFTGVSPVDVTGTESGLVHYSFLSGVFTASINSTRVRDNLLCPQFLELLVSALCLVATFAQPALLMHDSY
jgi:hypothetical protein